MDVEHLDRRPLIVAIAGPNGAGKTTFYHAHLAHLGLRFVNADVLAEQLDLGPYEAARVATALRAVLVERSESFVFETVLSDPVGEKVRFLAKAAEAGYTVVLCYVGLAAVEMSEQRVAMRASQGGHDVPEQKLHERFPRILGNLAAAIRELPDVVVFDNSDLATPFRLLAVFRDGRATTMCTPLPGWLKPVVPRG